MIIFKNMFSFALTFKAYEWLITNGTKATPLFNALGAIQVVICASSIPMCKSLLPLFFPFADVANLLYRHLRQTEP